MLKAITNKIRLLRLRSKEPYSIYYHILGFLPNDLSIYEQAFLHRSASAKTEKGKWVNNERLEFLGDAILDSIVADILFRKFENKKEGFLTNTRSKIVQRETLNKLAIQLGLDKLVVSATKGVSHNNYMYGNAFEAFVGAIYIDQGYDVCKHFIEERVIAPYIDLTQIARKEVNFKSKLIEWSQKNKAALEFRLIESFTDANNNPVFQTQVYICEIAGGVGTGYSKKESQQNAAKSTLKKLKADAEFKGSINKCLDKSNPDSEECHNEVCSLSNAMTTEWSGDPISPDKELLHVSPEKKTDAETPYIAEGNNSSENSEENPAIIKEDDYDETSYIKNEKSDNLPETDEYGDSALNNESDSQIVDSEKEEVISPIPSVTSEDDMVQNISKDINKTVGEKILINNENDCNDISELPVSEKNDIPEEDKSVMKKADNETGEKCNG